MGRVSTILVVTAVALNGTMVFGAELATTSRRLKPAVLLPQPPCTPTPSPLRFDASFVKARMALRSDRTSIARVERIRQLAQLRPLPTNALRAELRPLLAGKSPVAQEKVLAAIAAWKLSPSALHPATAEDPARQKRSEYQTMFENFDDKTNQLFNLLSTLMKGQKETQGSVVRNLL